MVPLRIVGQSGLAHDTSCDSAAFTFSYPRGLSSEKRHQDAVCVVLLVFGDVGDLISVDHNYILDRPMSHRRVILAEARRMLTSRGSRKRLRTKTRQSTIPKLATD